MQISRFVHSVCLLGLLGSAGLASADEPAWSKSLVLELRAGIQPCELNYDGEMKRAGDTFRLSMEGVTATPDGLGNTPYVNTINIDGEVSKGGRGFLGKVISHNADAAVDIPLDRGERVCLLGFDLDHKKGKIKTVVVTRSKRPFMFNGTQRAVRFRAALEFTLGNRLMEMTPDEAKAHLWKFITPDARASAGSDLQSGGAPTISLGAGFDDVRTALGAPEKTVNLGAKVIWVYKDLRVSFQDGKVADVQ